MKSLIVIMVLFVSVHSSSQDQCTASGTGGITAFKDMHSKCYESISNQIQQELEASITYLTMSAYFSSDSHFRPGVAKFLLDSAYEERAHAKKLMAYLLWRGGKIDSSAIKNIGPTVNSYKNVQEALDAALKLEKSVTENIKKIIKVCEGVDGDKHYENDYHAVDYLTGEFLQEQYDGLRKLSGHLATVARMNDQYGSLGEIFFDKTFPL